MANPITPPPLKPHEIFRYGYVWDTRKFNDLEIELYCYKVGRSKKLGGLGKFGHFKRFVDMTWNDPSVSPNISFVWNEWSERMVRSYCGEKLSAWAGSASAGKCFGREVLILMADGSTKFAADVVVGDLLMGDDGTPRRVLNTHSGQAPMYRVRQSDGDEWTCNGAHTLVLKRTWAGKKSRRRVGGVDEISVEDYLHSSDSYRRQRGMFTAAADFPRQDVYLEPRFYGLWLGDGRKGAAQISVPRAESAEQDYLRGWASRHDYAVSVYASARPSVCPVWAFSPVPRGLNSKGSPREKCADNPLLTFLRTSEDASGKRIRPEYLHNSRDVRMELLAGLIDSDGHAASSGGSAPTYFEICCSYAGLKDDIVFLARSLGFRVSCTERTTGYEGRDGKQFRSWRINIFGDTPSIPTLRKKCVPKKGRDSTRVRFEIVPDKVDDFYGFEVDGNHRFLLWNFVVVHNSAAAAICAIVEYLADPKHTLVIVTSTTLTGARQRIWKCIDQYWNALPGLPGVMVPSVGRIKGANLDGQSFGESTGIFLLASEKKREKDALGKLIGIKATDEEYTMASGVKVKNPGKLVLIADELPELPESLVHAAFTNLWANDGFKMIALGNPNSFFDAFGLVCKPKDGWDSVTEDDQEWETDRGVCLRFDGTISPRVLGDDRCTWMYSQAQIDQIAQDYGAKSVYYYRMVKAFWAPQGAVDALYAPSDIMQFGVGKVVWGLRPPIRVAALDPAFSYGGDRSILYFGTYGLSAEGLAVLQFDEFIPLQEDLEKVRQGTPRSQQIVEMFRSECEKRGISPMNAAFDATGAGPFGDLVSAMWSPKVMRVNFAGKASTRPVSPHDRTPANERYDNKVSELWAVGKSLLRAGQLKGISDALAKEMCQRTYDTVKGGEGMRIRVESKPDYKARIGESPDIADAAFVMLELCRERYAFKSGERQASDTPGLPSPAALPQSAWGQFVQRSQLSLPSIM